MGATRVEGSPKRIGKQVWERKQDNKEKQLMMTVGIDSENREVITLMEEVNKMVKEGDNKILLQGTLLVGIKTERDRTLKAGRKGQARSAR